MAGSGKSRYKNLERWGPSVLGNNFNDDKGGVRKEKKISEEQSWDSQKKPFLLRPSWCCISEKKGNYSIQSLRHCFSNHPNNSTYTSNHSRMLAAEKPQSRGNSQAVGSEAILGVASVYMWCSLNFSVVLHVSNAIGDLKIIGEFQCDDMKHCTYITMWWLRRGTIHCCHWWSWPRVSTFWIK